jgi:hypothetical protein
MKTATCSWEERVRQGLAEGSDDPALRDHAARCPVCRDVLAVSDWMLRFRDLTLDKMRVEEPLPAPGELWNLARARRAIDIVTVKKALKPLYLYRKIAWFVSAAGSAALVLLEFEKIKSLLASLPGLNALAAMLSKGGEKGAMSPAQQAILLAALGLAGILFLVLVTGIKRADAG